MLGFLYRIIVGSFHICDHEWDIYQEREISDGHKLIGVRFIMRCNKCGNLKTKRGV